MVPVGHVPNSRQPRFPEGRGTAIAPQDPRRRTPMSCSPGEHCTRGGDERGARRRRCRRLLPARRHRPGPAGGGGVHRYRLLQHIPGGALRLRDRRRGCALPGGGEFRDGAGGRARGSAMLSGRSASRRRSSTGRNTRSKGGRISWRRSGGRTCRRSCRRCRECWPAWSTWPRSGLPKPGPFAPFLGAGVGAAHTRIGKTTRDFPGHDDDHTGGEPDGTGLDGDGPGSRWL